MTGTLHDDLSTFMTISLINLILILILMDPCIVDYSVEIPTRCSFVIEFIIPNFLKTQHVSSGTPLIIRSSKLYLQPLVYMPIWWPAVAKTELFLRWEMFHTKVVEKNKTHILCSVALFRSSCRSLDNVEKNGRAGEARDDNMAHAHCMLDK